MPKRSKGRQQRLMQRDPATLNRRQARALLLKVSPWTIKPEMIRTIVRRSITTRPEAFKKQLDAVLVLVHQLYDFDQQECAMNPRLLAAQRDGSIKREFEQTARKLALAWQGLLDETK